MTSRTWFITGTSSGLGRLITQQALAQGDRVAATARDPHALADLEQRFGNRLKTFTVDVTDNAAIRRAVDGAIDIFGRIDILVNNAGYALFGAAEEVTDEQIERQIATNLIGSMQVVRAILPHMRAQGGGRILQHSSMGGQMALPALSIYHATKWGIEGFLESVALEVAPFNIRVTIVEPGYATTGIIDRADIGGSIEAYRQTAVGNFRRLLAMNRFPSPGDPEKIAQAIVTAAYDRDAPTRLVLGSDAYKHVHRALTMRLAEIERQKESSPLTDKST